MFFRHLLGIATLALMWSPLAQAKGDSILDALLTACKRLVTEPREIAKIQNQIDPLDAAEFRNENYKFLESRPLETAVAVGLLDRLIVRKASGYVMFFTNRQGWEYVGDKHIAADFELTQQLFEWGRTYADEFNINNPHEELELGQFDLRWADTDNQAFRIRDPKHTDRGIVTIGIGYGEPGGPVIVDGDRWVATPSGTPAMFSGTDRQYSFATSHLSPPDSLHKRLFVSWTYYRKSNLSIKHRMASPF